MAMAKLPLLDVELDPAPLLEAVAAKRRQQGWLLGRAGDDVKAYMDPEQAQKIADQIFGPASQMDPYAHGAYEPTGALKQSIADAQATIAQNYPDWSRCRELPVRVLISTYPYILGYSCLLHPQTIYLGLPSFGGNSPDLLVDNYLHEYAHIWLYLVQEISPFSAERHGRRYTLPSGTSNRSVTATVDAAYVAAVLRKYYHKTGNVERRRELTAYLAGCLMQIRNDPDLTAIGLSVCRRLAQEVASAPS